MAYIPKQEEIGFLQQGEEQDRRRGTEGRKTQRLEGSVVVDMEGLSLLAGVSDADTAPEAAAAATASPRAPMILQKTLSKKFSQRGERKTAGDGDALILPTTTSAAAGGDGKVIVASAAVDPNSGKFVAITFSPTVTENATVVATATASPRRTSSTKRNYGRRTASPWLDPRRILLFFATLSSMGTIILLYFTLSMGSIRDGGDVNAR